MATTNRRDQYSRAPSALRYMGGALLRGRSLPPDPVFPPLTMRWTGLSLIGRHADRFQTMTGLDCCSVLYPHVLGFRLQMVLLTHRAYPLPIWNALQIRNRLVRHRAVDRRATYDMDTTLAGWRVIDKGLEVDLSTRLVTDGRCDWESTVTYVYRGRFTGGEAGASPPSSPDLTGAQEAAVFTLPASGGCAFGRLTGDYNGIHLWASYARLFGFRSAFLHPQRSAGLCLGHLRRPDGETEVLDLWLKGPTPYGAAARLVCRPEPGGLCFGLSIGDDPRHAIAGRWSAGFAITTAAPS